MNDEYDVLMRNNTWTLHGLVFHHSSDLSLHGFLVSDWAGSVDDRRSTTGHASSLGPIFLHRRQRNRQLSLALVRKLNTGPLPIQPWNFVGSVIYFVNLAFHSLPLLAYMSIMSQPFTWLPFLCCLLELATLKLTNILFGSSSPAKLSSHAMSRHLTNLLISLLKASLVFDLCTYGPSSIFALLR